MEAVLEGHPRLYPGRALGQPKPLSSAHLQLAKSSPPQDLSRWLF